MTELSKGSYGPSPTLLLTVLSPSYTKYNAYILTLSVLTDAGQKELIELGLSSIINLMNHPKLPVQSLALKTLLLLIRKSGTLLARVHILIPLLPFAHVLTYDGLYWLVCLCADENRRAIRQAGGAVQLQSLFNSPNRTVATASQKALQMLNS